MVEDPTEFWENPNVTSEVNTILQDKQKNSHTKEEYIQSCICLSLSYHYSQ